MSSSADDDASSPPSEALMTLLAPDGYYKYLGIPKSVSAASSSSASAATAAVGGGSSEMLYLDEDLIKKNYRKLSLKHHPDRNGGDAETFRVLNRAQKVLTNPKLRQQYDILGLDLDDEYDDHAVGGTDGTDPNSVNGINDDDHPTTSQGIVHEIASMALTSVLQMGVRTLMMASVSLIVVRYRWTLFPALAFLAFIAFRIHSIAAGNVEMLSPFLIGTGLIIMHQSSQDTTTRGCFWYWIGESLVIAMFTFNSLSTVQKTKALYIGIGVFSSIAALWFRGNFWNYCLVLGLELFLAIFIAMAFPIMEMVLEAILNDKLKKVGDKVRAHHQHLEAYYASKR